jgi:hypothetical protein
MKKEIQPCPKRKLFPQLIYYRVFKYVFVGYLFGQGKYTLIPSLLLYPHQHNGVEQPDFRAICYMMISHSFIGI